MSEPTCNNLNLVHQCSTNMGAEAMALPAAGLQVKRADMGKDDVDVLVIAQLKILPCIAKPSSY